VVCFILCRLRESLTKASAESAAVHDLKESVRVAVEARDTAAQHAQSLDAALVKRDSALAAALSQLESSAAHVKRLEDELAAAVARAAAAQHQLHVQSEEAEQRLRDQGAETERRLKEMSDLPTVRMKEALAASETAVREQQRLGAILEDHLAAEGEIAVWYLHSAARVVPSKDVARALAALLEETRTRIDEHKARFVAERGVNMMLYGTCDAWDSLWCRGCRDASEEAGVSTADDGKVRATVSCY
jgi:chromosome segregation ATPase